MEREKRKKRAKIHIKKKKGNQTHEGLYDTTEKTTKRDLLKRGGLLFSQRFYTSEAEIISDHRSV